MNIKRLALWVGVAVLLVAAVVVYAKFDPAGNRWFPKCPFRLATGYDCPGCGSQRAAHALLNLDIAAAFRHNALMVVAIPYVIVGAVFDVRRDGGERYRLWRKRLFGPTAVRIVLVAVIGFWILRNILAG